MVECRVQKRGLFRIDCLRITIGSQRVIQRPMCWVPSESWLPDEYFEHLQISESLRKVPEMTVWKLHQKRSIYRINCLRIYLGSLRVILRPMCWVPLESWLPEEYFEHLQTSESLRKVPEMTGWKLHQKRGLFRIACLRITLGSLRVILRPMCWVPSESWVPEEYFEHLKLSESLRKVPEMTVWSCIRFWHFSVTFLGHPYHPEKILNMVWKGPA